VKSLSVPSTSILVRPILSHTLFKEALKQLKWRRRGDDSAAD
jgi:hypothetical protein